MIPHSIQIFGPPGCGKTEYLMRLIDDRISGGMSPLNICFVSFSRKSIQEARERAMSRFRLDTKQLARFRTLHSTGFTELGLSYSDVLNGADYRELGRMLGEEFNVNVRPEDGLILPTDLRRGSRYLQIIDRARYRMLPLEEEWKDHDTWDLSLFKAKQIADQLAEYKSAYSKVDYADMIDLYVQNAEPQPMDLFITDEAQDLTPLQWKMAEKMGAVAEEVYLAGDDDQAVHRWAGVEVKQFIHMSTNQIVLDQSYRLPKKIFNVAQHIVKRIKDRVPKPTTPRARRAWLRGIIASTLYRWIKVRGLSWRGPTALSLSWRRRSTRWGTTILSRASRRSLRSKPVRSRHGVSCARVMASRLVASVICMRSCQSKAIARS